MFTLNSRTGRAPRRGMVLFAAVILSIAPALYASPIGIFTFTGTATGTIDGTPFSNASLTVTATGDVGAVTFTSPTFLLDIPIGSASFSIGGIGSGTFSDDTYVFDNTGGVAGFGDNGATSCCDIIQVYDSLIGSTAFSTYDLQSSIGPLGPERSDPSTGDWVGLNTSLGSFTLTSFDSVTFQATVGAVPEPATLPLLGAGLAGLMFFSWRQSRTAKNG